MRLDDCYALLDIRPGAPEEELKRAHRDLAKVWHPDRFANDAALRRKAEEKLKAINEAYETILASRAGGSSGRWRAAETHEAEDDAAQTDAIRRYEVRNRTWALTCLAAALFVLVRRPTPGGLLIALLLFCAAVTFFLRMRAARARTRP